jgi:uncharacterized protein with PIN domain
MEIVGATENQRQHKWLTWVGLQEPPLDADSWVPVVRGLRVSDEQSGKSKLGARLIKLLADGNIRAEQQAYEFASGQYSRGAVSGLLMMGGDQAVHRIAVMVHRRDQPRATEIATELNTTLAQEARLEQAALDADVEREATDAARRWQRG